MIGLYFRIFVLLYFISILISKFWFDFWNSFVFQDNLWKRIPFAPTLSYFGNVSYFCHHNHGSQLTTTHSTFCYFVMWLILHQPLSTHHWINHMFTSGFNRISSEHIYKGGFDDQHMGFSVVIWSLMVINEHKADVIFRWIQRQCGVLIMDKSWLLLLVVTSFSSALTCTLEDDNKENYYW